MLYCGRRKPPHSSIYGGSFGFWGASLGRMFLVEGFNGGGWLGWGGCIGVKVVWGGGELATEANRAHQAPSRWNQKLLLTSSIRTSANGESFIKVTSCIMMTSQRWRIAHRIPLFSICLLCLRAPQAVCIYVYLYVRLCLCLLLYVTINGLFTAFFCRGNCVTDDYPLAVRSVQQPASQWQSSATWVVTFRVRKRCR